MTDWVETGSPKELVKFLNDSIRNRLHSLYMNVNSKKNFNPNNIDARRQYVNAYVQYVHFVEKVYQLTTDDAHSEGTEDSHSH